MTALEDANSEDGLEAVASRSAQTFRVCRGLEDDSPLALYVFWGCFLAAGKSTLFRISR